jgi:hypothetical protein
VVVPGEHPRVFATSHAHQLVELQAVGEAAGRFVPQVMEMALCRFQWKLTLQQT